VELRLYLVTPSFLFPGNIASDQEGRCSVLVGSTDHMPIVNDDDITGPDMEISNIHFKGKLSDIKIQEGCRVPAWRANVGNTRGISE